MNGCRAAHRWAHPRLTAFALWWGTLLIGWAQSTGVISYQGRVAVEGAAFDGAGGFKFGLVSGGATETFWLSSPDGNADGEPDQPISLPVIRGLFQIDLGETSVVNMAAIPASVFASKIAGLASHPLYLRVWFNDGVKGFQRLVPDQRLTAVSFAMAAASVADGAITPASLGRGAVATSPLPVDPALIGAGYVQFAAFPPPAWITSGAGSGASPRYAHAAVWVPTFGQMLVWGGQIAANTYADTGALYRPAADEWQAMTTAGAPSARRGATVVWDGATWATIWGGFSGAGFLNTGARFNLSTLTWQTMAIPAGFRGRDGHVAAQAGPLMIIWGGRDNTSPIGDGSLYDAGTDTWTELTVAGPPSARSGAASQWTGDRLLIWGGLGAGGADGTGGQLLFQTSPNWSPTQWKSIASLNAPSPRTDHTAVWTGTRFIVWGGKNGATKFADGASYDPIADLWTPLQVVGAPSARSGHVAVWNGAEMVIFSGETASGVTATGGAYDPGSNSWRPLNSSGSPVARTGATAVWTGTEMVVFGGQAGSPPLSALQRLSAQPGWYLYRKL